MLQLPFKIYSEQNDYSFTESKLAESLISSNTEKRENNFDFIPRSVYQNLPTILKEASEIFTEPREKDIFLTGALSAFGGCFYNTYAYNIVDKTKLSPNLFSFIVAPPASGKNVLMYAAKLLNEISDTFKAATFHSSKGIIIPANNTSAGVIDFLNRNNGIGVIIEPEIDIMINAQKQEWGDYSDLLRVSFENSPYKYYRKTKKEFIEIPQVKLSLAISGTPQQFVNFMKSPENGLFSRGCYYIFDDERDNIKCFGRLKTEVPINEIFKTFSTTANQLFTQVLKNPEVLVSFNEVQLQKMQDVVIDELNFCGAKEGEASVLRAFMVIQKIATTLTILNHNGEYFPVMNCNEEMLDIAIKLAITYLRHSYKALNMLDMNDLKKLNKLTFTESRVLSLLPGNFSRDEAIQSCKSLNTSTKTIDETVNKLKSKGYVVKVKHGHYEKTSNESENIIQLT